MNIRFGLTSVVVELVNGDFAKSTGAAKDVAGSTALTASAKLSSKNALAWLLNKLFMMTPNKQMLE